VIVTPQSAGLTYTSAVVHPADGGAAAVSGLGAPVLAAGGGPGSVVVHPGDGGAAAVSGIGPGAIGAGASSAGAAAGLAAATGLASVLFASAGAFVDDSAPATFFADNFNDNVLGPEWQQVRGTFNETAGRLRVVTLDTLEAWLAYNRRRWNTVDVSAVMVTAPDVSFRGLFARTEFDGSAPKLASGYVLRCTSASMRAVRYDAGVPTILTGNLTAPLAGESMRMTINSAGLISCYSAGVFRASATDTTYKGGYAGIFSEVAAIDFDDFSVDDTPA
jgi:hypothetical protein